MIAVELANMEHCRQLKVPGGAFTKINDAATALNVSPRTVNRAKKVKDSGNADLIHKVKSGKVSVTAAAKQVSAPPKPVPAD